MSSTDFLAMLPHLVLGGAIVLLMLVIAFVRNHALTATLTALSMLASLLAIDPSLEVLPRQVTPLFVFDAFGAFFSGLILIAGIASVVFSYRYLQGRKGDPDEYYLLLAIATFGAMTLAATTHFAGFLLGLEIVSISLYTLIAYPEEGHPPLEAGLKYLVLSGVASTTILFGLALLYNATGSMEFHAADRALTVQPNYEVYLAAGNILVFAGLAFKLSLVPFHMWTPDVYQGAPAPVSGFIATASKGAVVALVYRYLIGGGVRTRQIENRHRTVRRKRQPATPDTRETARSQANTRGAAVGQLRAGVGEGSGQHDQATTYVRVGGADLDGALDAQA